MYNIFILLFELSVNIFEAYIMVDFIVKFNGSKYNDCKNTVVFISVVVLLFIVVTAANFIDTSIEIPSYIALIIMIIYGLFALNGKVLIKVASCISINVIQILVNGFSVFIFSLIFDIKVDSMITTFGIYRFVMLISSKIAFFYVSRIILRFKYISNKNIPSSSWILVTVIHLLTIVIMVAITESAVYNGDLRVTFYLALSILCLIIINIIFYYTFMISIKNHEIYLENQLLKHNMELQKKHSIELMDLYKQIQTMRHDMKNQLIGAYALIEDFDYNRALNYILAIIKNIDFTKKFVFTENEMLNAIINNKFNEANDKGIKTSFNINCDLGNKINIVDINILFGNLLDNAIEACEKIKGEKEIFLTIEKQRGYISIQVNNSIENSVLQHNPNLLTVKTDKSNHGLGINSIRRIVQKYDGQIDFYENGTTFTSKILISEE